MTVSFRVVGLAVMSLGMVGGAARVASAQANYVELAYQYQHAEDVHMVLGGALQVGHAITDSLSVLGGVDVSRKSESVSDLGFSAEANLTLSSFFGAVRLARPRTNQTFYGQIGFGASRLAASAQFEDEELFDESSTEPMIEPAAGVKINLNRTWQGFAQVGLRRILADEGGNIFRFIAGVSRRF